MGSCSSNNARALKEASQSSLNCSISASTGKEKSIADKFHYGELSRAKEARDVLYAQITPVRPDTLLKKLLPVASVPRSRFPLAWINTTGRDVSLPPGRLLRLSKSITWGPHASEPIVTAVKLIPENEIYVLEIASDDTCVACGLWEWVTEQHLVSLTHDKDQNIDRENKIQLHTTAETLFAKQSPKKPRNKKGFLARKVLLPDKENVQGQLSPANDLNKERVISFSYCDFLDGDKFQSPSHTIEKGNDVASSFRDSYSSAFKPTVEHRANSTDFSLDIELEKLATQYLETLYLSIASVAFFAKGPLARVRNACLQNEGNSEAEILSSQFFKNYVLPKKKFDTKYNETLPMMIRDVMIIGDDDGKGNRNFARHSRRKQGRPGRNGLLKTEANFISQWWKRKHEDERASGAMDSKALLRDLQNREAQLQILYILEALILEPPTPQNTVKQEQGAPSLESIPTKSPRTQKKVDLNTSLEDLLDRLCIWHTVGDGIGALVGEALSSVAPKQPRRDKLREFCTEVIVPFYGVKLPMQCKKISRKLGDPAVISPIRARPSLIKSASISALPPGSAVTARRRPMQQQSLQRVLSDDRDIQRSRSPSISRSLTMSSVPALKREPSDSGSRPGSRESLSKNLRIDHREVDLAAGAKRQESKITRINSLVEQKKEFVDAIGKRTSLVTSKDPRKRSAKDDLLTSHAGVQVTATPKKQKVTQSQLLSSLHLAVAASSASPKDQLLSEAEEAAIPSSSLRATSSQPQRLCHTISTTPSATRTRPAQFLQAIQNTPLRMTRSQRPVQMTPLKKVNVQMDDVFRTAPVFEKPSKEVSIYETLGWEDEEDDLI